MKILLLEDDVALCQIIETTLLKNGYIVDSCNDGETGMLYALNTAYAYDVAIIDRMLPIIDGLSIIRAMRNKDITIPVIIITGMFEIEDRIEGLDGGADDYLVKPFHISELLARIRALTRRPSNIQNISILTYADLSLDKQHRQLSTQHQSVILTAKETALLCVFIQHPQVVFSREQLVLKVWGAASEIEPGNVDTYVSFLRKRLKKIHSDVVITTIYGIGYQMEKLHD